MPPTWERSCGRIGPRHDPASDAVAVEVPTQLCRSRVALAADLKARGFRFVGTHDDARADGGDRHRQHRHRGNAPQAPLRRTATVVGILTHSRNLA